VAPNGIQQSSMTASGLSFASKCQKMGEDDNVTAVVILST
jgi:hypothetical protein